MKATIWRGALGLLAVCTACQNDSNRGATQVVVVVGGDSALALLDVRVYDEAGRTLSSKRTIDLTARAPGRLPTSFTVVPAGGGDDTFRLTVQGFTRSLSGERTAQARVDVIAQFASEQTQLLPITLSSSCASERCGCTSDEPCDTSCESARCVAIARYSVLPEVEPGQELQLLRAGVGDCPRGSFRQPDGSCADLDECAFAIDDCSRNPSACLNLAPEAGRYQCVCPPGFRGNGEADDPCVR